MLACHSLDEDLSMLVDEDMGLRLLGVDTSGHHGGQWLVRFECFG